MSQDNPTVQQTPGRRLKGTGTLTDEAIDPKDVDPETLEEEEKHQILPAASEEGNVPDWALIPPHLKIPKGVEVVFVRLRAGLTMTPEKGDRQAICWGLTDGDEKMANDRCAGNSSRAASEYSKQMIRAIDGNEVSWMKSRGPGALDEFWLEIGPKGRNLLLRIYTQLNMASKEEVADFFGSCITVLRAG